MPLYPAALPEPYTAPSGAYQQAANFLTSAVASPPSGTLFVVPFDVAPVAKTYSGITCSVSTAQAGGTTTTSLGLWRDNGSGGLPNFVSGLITSGTVLLTTVGNRTFAATMTLAPGRYWGGYLYVQTAAPGTIAALNCINAAVSMWAHSAAVVGATSRALTASGLTALPTTQITLTAFAGATAPALGLLAA